MPLEIERRFLVSGDGWREHVTWEAELRQGYLLNREDGLTARIRLQQQLNREHQSWLTIKALPPQGAPAHARLEFEYPIPMEDAKALLDHAHWRVEKCRYGLQLPDGDWVLDVFSGENSPLVIAEVELQHPEDALQIPRWCGQEVTGVHQLSNAALASHPWQNWSAEDRALIQQAGLDNASPHA